MLTKSQNKPNINANKKTLKIVNQTIMNDVSSMIQSFDGKKYENKL